MPELTALVRVIAVCLMVALCRNSTRAADPPTEQLPPLNISKHKISFDPKTAEVGAVGRLLSLEQVVVKILSRTRGKCLFEYSYCGCGGMQNVERIEVPIDAGPVTIEFPSSGGMIVKSFPKTARVVYSRVDFVRVRALVPDTDEFVEFTIGSPRSEMYPQKGDKIKFRYIVYDSPKYEKHLPTADFSQRVEFEMGSDQVWAWLGLAMEEMSVGDERMVQVPVKVAAGATKWLTEPEKSTTIYASIRLVAIERPKK